MIIIKNLECEILRQIGALSRAIHYISDEKYKEINLQKGQFIFLTRICENPGINLITLSNMLRVDKTTTTKAIQRLIDGGYVIKEKNEEDKRGYKLKPTQEAINIYDFVIEEENRNIKVCFKNFNEEEKTLATNFIKRMTENTEDDWKFMKRERECTNDKKSKRR